MEKTLYITLPSHTSVTQIFKQTAKIKKNNLKERDDRAGQRRREDDKGPRNNKTKDTSSRRGLDHNYSPCVSSTVSQITTIMDNTEKAPTPTPSLALHSHTVSKLGHIIRDTSHSKKVTKSRLKITRMATGIQRSL